MKAAIKVVYNGCSIKRAALEHIISRTMLQDQITGNVEQEAGQALKLNPIWIKVKRLN